MKIKTNALFLLSLGILVAACAPFPGLMKPGLDSIDAYKPTAGEATIVFLCCGGLMGGPGDGKIAIFDLVPEGDKLVGVPGSGKKIGYKTTPGEHLFMIVYAFQDRVQPFNIDFMEANFSAGKTYFSMVESLTPPFAGTFYFIKPLKKEEVETDKIEKIRKTTKFIEKNPKADGYFSDQWKEENKIQELKTQKLAQWKIKKRRYPILPEYGFD